MHPDHQPEFDRMADYLQTVARGRPLVFVVNPGNWGDALIREGAEHFLRHYEFPYAKVHLKEFERRRVNLASLKGVMGHSDPVMVYNGCGAFTSHYGLLDRVQRLAVHFSSVVFLPCTINSNIDRSRFPSDLHIVVRDRFESLAAQQGALFCHDMAFFLNLAGAGPTSERGYFYRRDREAPARAPNLPPGRKNRDLSASGKSQHPIDGFVRAIARYSEVYTNRLHVAIAAALLGRSTYLSGNNYFKNRAIFDSSIDGVFPAVRFEEGGAGGA